MLLPRSSRGSGHLLVQPWDISTGRPRNTAATQLAKPWQQARPGVRVKLLPRDGELYVFADSANRVAKERAMRRRQLKWLWARLKQLSMMALSREDADEARRCPSPCPSRVAPGRHRGSAVRASPLPTTSTAIGCDGRAGARGAISCAPISPKTTPPVWNLYLLLVRVEEAFKNLKGDLAIRPIFHQDQARIEAHIFIAFLAYCLHATLARRLHALAPGLSPRSVIEKFAAMQMIDVHVPTTDGRELRLTRYTEPDAELRLLLDKLKLALPAQSPPKITTAQSAPQPPP